MFEINLLTNNIFAADPDYEDRQTYPNGAFYFPGLPYSSNLWWDEGWSQPDDPHPIWKPGVRVSSIPPLRLIIWCDAAFHANPVSLEDAERSVHAGQPIDSQPIMNTLAVQWLRELMEYTHERR